MTDQQLAMSRLTEASNAAVPATSVKSAFVATVSHEIRTPMNAVIGMGDLLTNTDLDDHQRELVDRVHSRGDALVALINATALGSGDRSSGDRGRAGRAAR